MMSNFSNTILEYISNNNLVGIRAGSSRKGFLPVWMVVVNKRVFVRSWGLAEKSWYNTFLENNTGAIDCGGEVIPVMAIIPGDIGAMNRLINEAYLKKYDYGSNSFYAQGITGEQHMNRTVELIPFDAAQLFTEGGFF
jgi:hypothetical protein